MKRILYIFLSIILVISVCPCAYAADALVLDIDSKNLGTDVSPTLYGVDLTGTALCSDGALSSNLVSNNSFEISTSPEANWSFAGCSPVLSTSDAICKSNPTYETITFDGKGTVRNNGAVELYKYKTYTPDSAAALSGNMGFKQGEKYEFSCYLKNIDFEGTALVYLDSKTNSKNLVKLDISSISTRSWSRLASTITAAATEVGSLAILFEGKGSIMLDYVSLIPQSSFGYGTDLWKNGSLRLDMYNAIKNLSPEFVRFTCGAAQNEKKNYYSWKDTIGTPSERRQADLAYSHDGNGDYYNTSNELGTHEYLQLCEELGAVAIPLLNSSNLDSSSDEFTNYKQDIIDLIEYANGDSVTSYWGALRAGNGHNGSFNLKYIQINGDNAAAVKAEIEKKYNDIEIITDSFDGYSAMTDYGNMITQNNMGSALMEARLLLENESGSATRFSAYKNTFAKVNANQNETNLIWFNAQDLIFTPSYYTQMLFANNVGTRCINASVGSETVSSSVTIDDSKQVLYIKLVNSDSSSRRVVVNLKNFENVNHISSQYIQSGYKSTSNEPDKQRIAPTEIDLSDMDGFELSLSANSINVIRVAYGDNNGATLYQLPDDIDYKTKKYIPAAVKVIIPIIAITVPLGSVLGYMLYRKGIFRKKDSSDE